MKGARIDDCYSKFYSKYSLPKADKQILDMIPKDERELMFYNHALAQFKEFLCGVNGTASEKHEAFIAATKLQAMQIVNVIIAFIATNTSTASQVLTIIKNIDSYRITPFVTSFDEVGKYWHETYAQMDSHYGSAGLKNVDYKCIAEKLYYAGIVKFTPFGVLWNV